MFKQFFILFLIMAVATRLLANAEVEGNPSNQSIIKSSTDSMVIKQTVGFAIDLLPPIMSATTGNFGYSAQMWYGNQKFRLRTVIAGFQMPDKLIGNDDFQDLHITATALIFDGFRNYNFKGWWVGGGFELWNNTITSKTDNNNYTFNNYVATAGMGYIFKVYKNFYIEPWGAMHYVLNNEPVTDGETVYETKKFQGEVSLKIGWHFLISWCYNPLKDSSNK